jgi:hypothetical protein
VVVEGNMRGTDSMAGSGTVHTQPLMYDQCNSTATSLDLNKQHMWLMCHVNHTCNVVFITGDVISG